MSVANDVEVSVLQISLNDRLVGHLSNYRTGRNVLRFADSFVSDANRPTLSLITHPAFPNSEKILSEHWSTRERLHPVLSNLLPEGSLRNDVAKELKVHIDREFPIFSFLGRDLPGAIVARDVHDYDVMTKSDGLSVRDEGETYNATAHKFSLAGVQMKFSMCEEGGRYNVSLNDRLGNWIVKTPTTQYKSLPLNEFSAMSLAREVGIDMPEIKLIPMDMLEDLPSQVWRDEQYAFAIKRFDRNGNERIHAEDFAQVLVKYPHEKYDSANYENIGKLIYEYSHEGLEDVQQYARRLLVNILLANGDAHLKNWSLLYADSINPRLSPAYDIVTTHAYIPDETTLALNLYKTKKWYDIGLKHFEAWSNKVGVPWRTIKPHLDDVTDRAKTLWPNALNDLPMDEPHKQTLRNHWTNLHPDFRFKSS